MKTFVIPCAIALLFAPVASAQIAAGNVRPAQRADSKLVDIDYDVTGTNSPVSVSLEGSADGGSTWTLPVNSLTGAVGNNVTPGSNLRITWDAGADWNQQVSSQTKFRIMVSDIPPSFSLIPAGVFTMGDALDNHSSAPTHTVNVSDFYMAQNLVTKAQWDNVRTWAISNGYTDLPAGVGKASDHPVLQVSWWGGVKYCNARSQQEGLTPVYTVGGAVMKTGTTVPVVNWTANGYRLPTEAEWEKAARGGLSGKRFPWGDSITHNHANYNSLASHSYDVSLTRGLHPVYGITSPFTSPVATFAANGYGLYDMSGNAWQWCWDWYGTYDTSIVNDPRGVASGSDRVRRGGACHETAVNGCVAYRSLLAPTNVANNVGFRPVRSSVP